MKENLTYSVSALAHGVRRETISYTNKFLGRSSNKTNKEQKYVFTMSTINHFNKSIFSYFAVSRVSNLRKSYILTLRRCIHGAQASRLIE